MTTLKDYIGTHKFDIYKGRIGKIKANLVMKNIGESTTAILAKSFPSCLKLAGYELDSQNHGAPMSPGVIINMEESSSVQPQAWSQEIGGETHWFYNYPGACIEAEYLGKTIPTIEQWLEILNSIEGDAGKKAEILNITFNGCWDANKRGFRSAGSYSDLWSSSLKDEDSAHFIILRGDIGLVMQDWDKFHHGLSLRLMEKKK